MIRPSIIAAGFFAFLASFDDVTVALFISGTSAVTLPVKMWESVRLELDPTLAAVSSVLVLLSIALLSMSELAKRLGKKAGPSPLKERRRLRVPDRRHGWSRPRGARTLVPPVPG
ncbi:MAG TPA: hypothetical protein VGN91_18020 [Bosea sp. (in: a-proteobacteria)]|jgi:ABC-type spermidine/putrescine transport system permease subunit II|nr:hypothetical protein [Bosea sp. (in: a-proteobacteria)]